MGGICHRAAQAWLKKERKSGAGALFSMGGVGWVGIALELRKLKVRSKVERWAIGDGEEIFAWREKGWAVALIFFYMRGVVVIGVGW